MESILHLLKAAEEIPSLESHKVFDFGILTVTSSTMMAFLAILVFAGLAYLVNKYKLLPSRAQSVVEMIVEWLIDFVAQIVGDKKKAITILPYVGSVFFFILFSNLISLIPGLTSITFHGHPLFSASTADFNTTFALALAAVVVVHIVSVIENGVWHHLSHFIQIDKVVKGFKKSAGEGSLGIVNFFVGLIEIIGELAKVISLSLRLFGNMFAHEVLMVILLGAISIGVPAIWMGMGILVVVVQAIVFTALITVYYSLLVPSTDNSH